MTLDKVAIIPSIGLGDGLMMMVASHRLYCHGYNVTTFSSAMIELHQWFSPHTFKARPQLDQLEKSLKEFDLIIFQHENTPFGKALVSLFHENKVPALSVFYPKYEEHKHFPLTPLDRVFNEKKPMVDNIARAISSILGLNHISKNNGLVIPNHLIHRKYKHRVLLHPTCSCEKKTWPKEKYISLAALVEQEGFLPIFCVGPKEHAIWAEILNGRFNLPYFSTLSDLASFAFESGYLIGNDSGLGHLCSNLQIPTLIVSSKQKHMNLWRPSWYKGEIVTPAPWIPNFKGSRLRENKWKHFISPKKVYKSFGNLVEKEAF